MSVHAVDLTSSEHKSNPFPTFAKLREQGPLLQVHLDGIGTAWVSTTYEATTRILRDKELFAVDPGNAGRKNMAGLQWWMPRSIKRMANNMLGKDEPDHRRLRQLVESAFMQQSIDAMRPRIAELVEYHLNGLQEMSRYGDGEVDFVEDFARPFPLDVIGELLGLPPEDRQKFRKWGTAFSRISNINNPFSMVSALRAIFNINCYLKRQIDLCRKEPRPGMLSALVEAEQEGHKLSEDELLASAFLLLIAGHETTIHLLTVGLRTLLQHPRQKQELMNDWSKSYTAVDEILRYSTTIEMTKPRYARRDVELFGQHVKQGDVVVPLLAAANHDPAKFPNPEVFDINRSPNPHVAFGTGIHVCLGQKLAHAEVEIAFEKLLTRFPHLELSIEDEDLDWTHRIGTRVITRLPVNLKGASSVAQGAHSDAA